MRCLFVAMLIAVLMPTAGYAELDSENREIDGQSKGAYGEIGGAKT